MAKKNQELETMPETFKTEYPSTRCIIDCTKIFCQTPSSLSSQSSLCSSYKHHVKYKGLFGIAPTRAKSFISELYAGWNSHKKSFRKSFILNKNPWKDNDSIMADCRFTIAKELEPLNMNLNIPLFPYKLNVER